MAEGDAELTGPTQPEQHGRERGQERDDRTGRSAAAERIRHQHRWVDLQIERAMARGDFDDLPGAGKPIPDLGASHDPDWWLRKLVERERISVLPPALQLRKDDAELDDRLDHHNVESEVRRELEEFNARVLKARYTPVDGPPLITQPRDVEAEVEAWRGRLVQRLEERRAERRGAAAAGAEPSTAPDPTPRSWRSLLRRRRSRPASYRER